MMLIPRRKYYDRDLEVAKCPECGEEATEEKITIMLTVKSTTDEGQFFVVTNGIYFCPTCPVVIFDSDEIDRMAMVGIRGGSNVRYAIIGMVDSDSIPEEKKQFEYGSEENPIPLVEFLPDLGSEENDSNRSYRKYVVTKPKKIKEKLAQRKRVGRNQPCPCGSGKKYKRCCGK